MYSAFLLPKLAVAWRWMICCCSVVLLGLIFAHGDNDPKEMSPPPPPLQSFTVANFEFVKFHESLKLYLQQFGLEPNPFSVGDYNKKTNPDSKIPTRGVDDPLGFELMTTPMFADIVWGSQASRHAMVQSDKGTQEEVLKPLLSALTSVTQSLGGVLFNPNVKLPGGYMDVSLITALSTSSYHMNPKSLQGEPWFDDSVLPKSHDIYSHKRYGGYSSCFRVLVLQRILSTPAAIVPYPLQYTDPDTSAQRYVMTRGFFDMTSDPEHMVDPLPFGFWKDISFANSKVKIDCSKQSLGGSFCDTDEPSLDIKPPPDVSAIAFIDSTGPTGAHVLRRLIGCFNNGQASGDLDASLDFHRASDGSPQRAAKLLFTPVGPQTEVAASRHAAVVKNKGLVSLGVVAATLAIIACYFVTTCCLVCAYTGCWRCIMCRKKKHPKAAADGSGDWVESPNRQPATVLGAGSLNGVYQGWTQGSTLPGDPKALRR
eukprot:GHVS01028904.1.p1 GENE.GHVS01028904.1~~GHVS01028904.1.p1  ORF type:complete len:500 (+),score=56.85 GHVS01028904.1:50-1501(+)